MEKSTDLLKKKILIIEDDVMIGRAYQEGLSSYGVEVTVAPTAEAGFEFAKTERPNIILLDLMLPDMPGEKALRILKENSDTAAIPVVILSNKSDDADINNCLHVLGAADYLVKLDVTIEALFSIIQKYAN